MKTSRQSDSFLHSMMSLLFDRARASNFNGSLILQSVQSGSRARRPLVSVEHGAREVYSSCRYRVRGGFAFDIRYYSVPSERWRRKLFTTGLRSKTLDKVASS